MIGAARPNEKATRSGGSCEALRSARDYLTGTDRAVYQNQ
jgi:hypothetical protein